MSRAASPPSSFSLPRLSTMHSRDDLCQILHRIDGRGYKAYKDLKGLYDFSHFRLSIDHVQGDPFALPSRVSIQIPSSIAGFPPQLFSSPIRKIALVDFLARSFDKAIQEIARGNRGKRQKRPFLHRQRTAGGSGKKLYRDHPGDGGSPLSARTSSRRPTDTGPPGRRDAV